MRWMRSTNILLKRSIKTRDLLFLSSLHHKVSLTITLFVHYPRDRNLLRLSYPTPALRLHDTLVVYRLLFKINCKNSRLLFTITAVPYDFSGGMVKI